MEDVYVKPRTASIASKSCNTLHSMSLRRWRIRSLLIGRARKWSIAYRNDYINNDTPEKNLMTYWTHNPQTTNHKENGIPTSFNISQELQFWNNNLNPVSQDEMFVNIAFANNRKEVVSPLARCTNRAYHNSTQCNGITVACLLKGLRCRTTMRICWCKSYFRIHQSSVREFRRDMVTADVYDMRETPFNVSIDWPQTYATKLT